ncbi:MFS transporter [Kitasatospora phosalacinea]|uniref:MFS transporter n=1 Tax=Kitasatospora phosalacinea TaxID=2065 RepID=UPI003654E532
MDGYQEARRARRRFGVVFATHGAVTGTFVTRIPWIQEHLGLTAGELGLALVAPAIGASLAMPMAGRVAHRYGSRAAVRALMVLWCLVLALPALAPNLAAFWAALLVYGATSGMASVQLNAQGVEVERRMGRSVMSGLHGLWSAGGLLASGLGVLAAHRNLDARPQLAVTALLLAALAVVACRGLFDVRPEPEEEAPPRFGLPPRAALAIGAVGFCGVFAEGASMDWGGVYLRDVAGASQSVAAFAFTAFAATMSAARLAGDLVVRRLGPVRTVRAGGAVAALGGVLVVASSSPLLAVPGFALIGTGVAVVVPLAFAAAGRTAEPSRAIAGVATLTYTAGLLAPAVIGLVAQTSSLTASFALVTVLAAALVPASGALRQRRPGGRTPVTGGQGDRAAGASAPGGAAAGVSPAGPGGA